MLENDVDQWVQACVTLQSNMCLKEVDRLVREEESVQLDASDDEKENIVVENVNKKTVVGIVGTGDNEEGQFSIRTEKTVAFTEKPDRVGYWKWDSTEIENRLQLQKFQHHSLTLGKTAKEYTYAINSICPPSPTDSQMHGNALMLNQDLRLNAVQFRYRRVGNGCKEVMCRLCITQRWISQSMFDEHMAIAHGLLNTETYGLIALPPPAALYKQQLDSLKFYYAKCSKCITWIRLGKVAGVNSIDPQLETKEFAASVMRSSLKEGLYTNYFVHFIECAGLHGKCVL